MTPLLRPLRRLLPCLLLAPLSAFAQSFAEALPWSRADFVHEVQLIPLAPDADPGLPRGLDYLSSQLGRPFTDEEATLLRRTDAGPWRRYQDDLLAFDIPDDPTLRIETVFPEDDSPLRVVGGRTGTTDNRYERAYRLTAGADVPYLIILVSPERIFDDGICFCGAIAYSKFLARAGHRMRFDLLDNGEVKRAQMLGPARAMLMEWTHTAITQAAYIRIASSIRFVDATASLVRPASEQEGPGWLERGLDAAGIEALLGPPTRTDGARLIYEEEHRLETGEGWRMSLLLPLIDGRFHGFEPSWRRYEELPPVPGSVAWAKSVPAASPPDGSAEDERRRVLDAFLENAPQASGRLWNEWCQIAAKLAEHDVKDPRVAELVATRFAEPELAAHAHHAAWVLHRYEAAGRHDLFARAARRILEQPSELGFISSDLGNLLSFLGAGHPEFAPLMELALRHDDTQIRATGLFRADKLPADRARAAARTALDTEDDAHALNMAGYLIRDVGVVEDIPWIEAKLARPSLSAQLRERLDEALEEIKKRGR